MFVPRMQRTTAWVMRASLASGQTSHCPIIGPKLSHLVKVVPTRSVHYKGSFVISDLQDSNLRRGCLF
jgi:hypothetical protein